LTLDNILIILKKEREFIMAQTIELQSIEFITTPEGKTKSVVLSLADWQKINETLHIMSNRELFQSIRRAQKQLKKGTKMLTFEEVFENL
jgi:PHD/YefM family antitoxin component YafN of YafNO toxin-antitoxin module